MVARLRVELNGRQALNRELHEVETGLDDWTPAFTRMMADFKQTQRSLFAAEGAFEGFPRWAPLSPSYRAWKSEHHPGKPILVLTGRLRAMLTGEGSGLQIQMDRRSLTISASYPVGTWNLVELHHLGTRRMPARPAFRLTTPEKTRWVKYLHEYLVEEVLKGRR